MLCSVDVPASLSVYVDFLDVSISFRQLCKFIVVKSTLFLGLLLVFYITVMLLDLSVNYLYYLALVPLVRLCYMHKDRFTKSYMYMSHQLVCSVDQDIRSYMCKFLSSLLGPFYGAIAVPSVTRCRCRCCCCRRRCRCGHRFYIAIHQVSLLSHAACAIAIAGLGSSW